MSSIEKEMSEMIEAADTLYKKLEAAATTPGTWWVATECLEKHRWDAYKLSENLREIKHFLGV